MLLLTGICTWSVGAADLTAEQVEQQIQLSHMLGEINQEEQNYRIQKVRVLGVDGYYEWLQNNEHTSSRAASNNNQY